MKVNSRVCDICGDQMSIWYPLYWLRKPIIRWGVPFLGMPRLDICDTCFAKISVMVQHPELIRNFGGDPDELAGEDDGEKEAGEAAEGNLA